MEGVGVAPGGANDVTPEKMGARTPGVFSAAGGAGSAGVVNGGGGRDEDDDRGGGGGGGAGARPDVADAGGAEVGATAAAQW